MRRRSGMNRRQLCYRKRIPGGGLEDPKQENLDFTWEGQAG